MKNWTLLAACAALGLGLGAAPAYGAGAPAEPPGEEDGSRTLSDADSYVRLPAVQTPIQTSLRMSGMLQVSLALDVPSAQTRREIGVRRVWLRDAYNETLLLYASRLYRWGDVPDADMISELLQEDTDRLLGPEAARVVLDTIVINAS